MSTTTDVQPVSHSPNTESPFVSRVQRPTPFTLVIFGATGDLAGRKLCAPGALVGGRWRATFNVAAEFRHCRRGPAREIRSDFSRRSPQKHY